MHTRNMYIDRKTGGIIGPARIGRVSFSKSGRSLYYSGLHLKMFRVGFKVNFIDLESGDEYWISGCKKRGGDRLYPGLIEIDPDVREEYWRAIRGLPQKNGSSPHPGPGKHGGNPK